MHIVPLKAGEIITKETKRGIELHAWNHQRRKMLHIGTLQGATYEKQAPILRQPEPSFCLPHGELAAVEDAGARYVRIVTPEKHTYAIAVSDFRRCAEPFFNRSYGPQLRCALRHFQYSAAKAKRNAHSDNPPIPKPAPIIRERQLGLFG